MPGPSAPRCTSPDDLLRRDALVTRGRNVTRVAGTTLLEREILDALDSALRPSELLGRFRAARPEIERTLVRLYRLGLIRPAGQVLVPLDEPRTASSTPRPWPARTSCATRVATPIGTPVCAVADDGFARAGTVAAARQSAGVEMGRAVPLTIRMEPVSLDPPSAEPVPSLDDRPPAVAPAPPGVRRPAPTPTPAPPSWTTPPAAPIRGWPAAIGLATAASVAVTVLRGIVESLRGG